MVALWPITLYQEKRGSADAWYICTMCSYIYSMCFYIMTFIFIPWQPVTTICHPNSVQIEKRPIKDLSNVSHLSMNLWSVSDNSVGNDLSHTCK